MNLQRLVPKYNSFASHILAQHLFILPALSSSLDIQSLRMIAASHNYQLSINGNNLTWTFKNILLTDSTVNEKASHGFISFQVKVLPSVTAGTSIANRSAIYFDANAPVLTNSSVTLVKNLPPPPARPITDIKDAYCMQNGDQQVQILNYLSGYRAAVSIDSIQPQLAVAANGSFIISPVQLKAGPHTLRTEYINETGYNFSVVNFSVSDPAASPVVSLTTDKTTLGSASDVALVSTSSTGGGTSPLYAFSLSKSFNPLLQAESGSSGVTISAAALPNTTNTVYVRMKSSDTCLNNIYAYDSIIIMKNNISTGLIDMDNPGVVINTYPNPVASSLTIVGLSTAKKYNIALRNQTGSTIRSLRVYGVNTKVIAVNNLAAGSYWISIYDVGKNLLIGTMQVFKK